MMLSRIADNLFWLDRYMERVDALSRSLRYFYILWLDAATGLQNGYTPLLRAFTSLSDEEIAALANDTPGVLHLLVADTHNSNSIKVLLGKARENARGSQDKITKEVWEQVNAMYHFINAANLAEKINSVEVLEVLDKMEKHCLLYNGIVDSTMPRGLGWQFMNVGKFIERTLFTLDLADAYFNHISYDLETRDDLVYWRSLLLSLSGYELYLKNNRSNHHNRQVMCQVMFNPDFPRSVFYSLARLQKYLEALLEKNEHREAILLEKKFGRLKSMVEFADTAQMTGADLQKLVSEIRQQMWDFSAELSKLFFSYT
jgi:uncharacterized alpha-E superfamily protein